MFQYSLITAASIGVACAVLSVIVVLRRWAFIGEGIAHAGYGGIGTAWLLSLAFPVLGNEGAVYAIAIGFCMIMAVGIGYISRGQRVASDAAIGIFLVGSLAWGYLALALFAHFHPRGGPNNTDAYLFGQLALVSREVMLASLFISAAVLVIVAALFKEIIYYAFDPLMAQVSGLAVKTLHYLLMMMLALVIVVGMRLVGNVLVTALLILPGATALLLGRRLFWVFTFSIIVALIGTLGGLLVNHYWPFLPSGPSIVLVLFAQFALSYLLVRAT
jgi:manganese/iron transport system permease protein